MSRLVERATQLPDLWEKSMFLRALIRCCVQRLLSRTAFPGTDPENDAEVFTPR